jgi:hypothetical protein
MNDIRAKFEEIWPVPEGVYWRDSKGQYGCDNHTYEDAMDTHNIRLDTFTRCQETTDVYVSLVDELLKSMRLIETARSDLYAIGVARESIGRAKQKLEQIK